MISKDQLAAAMKRECDICQHLFTKLSPEAMDYRPSPGQRTTTGLLRYRSICGIAGLRCMGESNWKLFSEYTARAAQMGAADFPAAMARQKDEIGAWFDSVTEEMLETQPAKMPGGGTPPLGVGVLNGPFKWLAAYKLQLFLYAKSAGATEIGTANAWAGVDPKGPA